MDEQYLAIVDADKIHDYVFSPHELKLIRGGSRIQSELNEVELLEILKDFGYGNVHWPTRQILDTPTLDTDPTANWEVISAGGGTTMVAFRQWEEAERYCSNAVLKYGERTAAATATWAVVRWQDDFKNTLLNLFSTLELNKTGRGHHSIPITSPYWKICESCGLYPASGTRRDPEGRERYQCQACVFRRKKSISALLLPEISTEAGRRIEEIDSFADLGELSQPENYLALVYLDIDRLGEYMRTVGSRSKETYRNLSRKIRETVKRGVMSGCASATKLQASASKAPFEVLLLGGDDAIVMLCAQDVFRFLRSFDGEFRSGLNDLNYSAAVVWAHQQFPIAQFLDKAEQLMRSAKRRKGDTVDYLVIAESLIQSLDEVRQAAAFDGNHRTARPYSLSEFLALRQTLLTWKEAGVPASKARALYRIAYEPFEKSLVDYWFVYSRLTPEHQDLWKDSFQSFDGMWETATPRRTRAADLAELWDFVEE